MSTQPCFYWTCRRVADIHHEAIDICAYHYLLATEVAG